MRRAVAFLSFTIAILAFINFAFRVRPDNDNLTEISAKFDGVQNLPSGDVVLDLMEHNGTVYIKSSLATYFDSAAFTSEVRSGDVLYMSVEKDGLRDVVDYHGNILSLRTTAHTYLPLNHAMNAYRDAVHSARRGFIQFLILTMVLLVPELTRKRRAEHADSTIRPISL
ncbi:hypothetical protein AB9P05_17025 [Roseivirga sp. BDSF3-8]|uniref:hypothetical protein n=1 Tax=Roseivirga sp. BDSF3-8 TaxID=3241598 RepID=UPI00353275CF